jgi:spoIIIJ-associated protein
MSQSNEHTGEASLPEDEANGEADEAGAAEPEQTAEGASGAAGRDSSRGRRRRRQPQSIEPGDDRAATALDFLNDVLTHMEMDCQVNLVPASEGNEADIALEISGRDTGRVIGKKGQVLAALQFLVNRVINRPDLGRRYVTVDAEGYRSRRDDSLATMARRLGQQAVTDGKIITFEPMNPRDRRVVHLALAKFEGVVTKSEGEGPDRRVQIIPVRRG